MYPSYGSCANPVLWVGRIATHGAMDNMTGTDCCNVGKSFVAPHIEFSLAPIH